MVLVLMMIWEAAKPILMHKRATSKSFYNYAKATWTKLPTNFSRLCQTSSRKINLDKKSSNKDEKWMN